MFSKLKNSEVIVFFLLTEQGRLDGALCSYTSAEKMNFLKKAHDECGIRNIEMEVNMMSSLCRRYGVRC